MSPLHLDVCLSLESGLNYGSGARQLCPSAFNVTIHLLRQWDLRAHLKTYSWEKLNKYLSLECGLTYGSEVRQSNNLWWAHLWPSATNVTIHLLGQKRFESTLENTQWGKVEQIFVLESASGLTYE